MNNAAVPSLQERRQEVLATLGATLLIVQLAEKAVKAGVQIVLPKSGNHTVETILTQWSDEKKKTLGYFLSQARARVFIEEKFDCNLKHFLKLRNQFIHEISEVEGLNFETYEGLTIANEYIIQVASLAAYVMMAFMGLIRSWQEKLGIQDDLAQNELFQEIDSDYKPAIDYWFKEVSYK